MMIEPSFAWAEYSARVRDYLRAAEELGGLDAEVLRASAPPMGRRILIFLCNEVPMRARAAYALRLAEESLVDSIDTTTCVTALVSLERRLVLPTLPKLAGQILTAALSGDDENDTDCSNALDLLYLYGEHDLLRLVLPTLLSLDDWIMTRNADGFVESHGFAVSQVTDQERQQFLESVDSAPFPRTRDRDLAEVYGPVWERWRETQTAIDVLHKNVASAGGPDGVLSYALSAAAEDERYVLARFIADHYHSGQGDGLRRAAELTGPDFAAVLLPSLLDVAARRCRGAARLYRDLRAEFSVSRRPDLVEDVTVAEYLAYGRHDGRGHIVQIRP